MTKKEKGAMAGAIAGGVAFEVMRRRVTAIVAACTFLFTCLTIVLIYQWVTLAVFNQREKKLKAEIAAYEQILEQDEKDLEYYESDLYKEWEAMKLGFVQGNK